ncbi:hypothetical protein [Janthinobacterium sp. SUN120]|uniref:hypothetical protein n=1 Tax=Janthinobacterium sp. SUN120 TaxID=3004099 RepID=UPI0025AF62E4|nr:hypothetical protein [Janthinobacterium sp. SUN120]MDN2713663.1 hypothetical protein [Janthinobacterium sp. SUN120]
MNKQNSKRIIYYLGGLPAGVFGESYVVLTAIEISTGLYRCEQFILTQRPTESLQIDHFEIDCNRMPPELGEFDIDFALDEGKQHAELLVSELLEHRANNLGRAELALSSFQLSDRHSTFVGCRMRGVFVKQLSEMRAATKCTAFSSYLGLVEQVAVVRGQ